MEKKYNNSFGEALDNLIGTEGLKTDVAVKLNPTTIPILIVSIMVGVIAGIIIAGAITKSINKG
jgi:hypothetical protein